MKELTLNVLKMYFWCKGSTPFEAFLSTLKWSLALDSVEVQGCQLVIPVDQEREMRACFVCPETVPEAVEMGYKIVRNKRFTLVK